MTTSAGLSPPENECCGTLLNMEACICCYVARVLHIPSVVTFMPCHKAFSVINLLVT
jgi:hypothetical protein